MDITGTTTITSLAATAIPANPIYFLRFTGALTLTNGASLILPGGANITTAAGDCASTGVSPAAGEGSGVEPATGEAPG